ncbi:MAG: 4Fe-4S binding protein [Candidatus Brockarchaeota archaeon]|nr:4Fe-4S binding protein [Candidatus Brockarchaeota archaeon]
MLAKKYTIARAVSRTAFLALLVGLPFRSELEKPLILPISLPPNLGRNFAVPALDLSVSALSSASSPAMPLAVLLLLPLVLGRAFCSWVCPIGLLHEISSPRRKEGKITFYRNVKYAFLAAALLLASAVALQKLSDPGGASELENALGSSSFPATLADPSSLIFDFLPAVIQASWAAVAQQRVPTDALSMLLLAPPAFWIRLSTIVLVVVGASRIPWFWCKYACPSGAAQALSSRFSFLHLRRELHKCSKCKRCQRACPMDVKILEEDWRNLSNAECTLCLKCVEECENGALRAAFL